MPPLTDDIDKVLQLAEGMTPGDWELWTGCSWRRIGSSRGESIVEPTKQQDGHPDLWFRQGFDGPDARCILAVPTLFALLRQAREALVQQSADAVDARRWVTLMRWLNDDDNDGVLDVMHCGDESVSGERLEMIVDHRMRTTEPERYGDGHFCAHHPDDPAHGPLCYRPPSGDPK